MNRTFALSTPPLSPNLLHPFTSAPAQSIASLHAFCSSHGFFFSTKSLLLLTMDIHRVRFVDYKPHTVTALAFSHRLDSDLNVPTNLRLAVGRSNGDIEIWNPRHGWIHELTLLGARGRSIEGLSWSIDGTQLRLFLIGGSTSITEWDLSTQKPVANYDCNAGVIWSIDVNKSGNQLCVGCDDGSVVIIDISGGPGILEHYLICQRQDLRVLSVSWYQDDLIVGGCADGRVRCWDTGNSESIQDSRNKGRLVGTMRVDKSKTESTLVWSVKVLSKRRWIISGDSTGSLKVWDLKNFTLLQSFKVHDADVLCLATDESESKLFSAGVDRKIHQYLLLIDSKKKTSKWTHNNSHLVHLNDVRSMITYEARGCNFLISGGVEKAIVIQLINQFNEGKFKKLGAISQKPLLTFNYLYNLVIAWQDQEVRIWKVNPEKLSLGIKPFRLAAKLTLTDDENISSVLINEEASYLTVATISGIKVFSLGHAESGKIQILKVRDSEFDLLAEDGAKFVKFILKTQFVACLPENSLSLFEIEDDETVKITRVSEVDVELDSSSRHPYGNSINFLCIAPNGQLYLSRFNGSIEGYKIVDGNIEAREKVTKLANYPILMSVSNSNTLLVVTEDNKLYELDPNGELLLTNWSKRNSEFLPKQFLAVEDKPLGIFADTDKESGRIWVYGATWLAFFDLNLDIPMNKHFQNTNNGGRKRDRDGLHIQEIDTIEGSNEFDGNADILENNVEILELSLKQSVGDRFRESHNETTGSSRPFWMTNKYRLILGVDASADGIIVAEMPTLADSAPAFHLPKLRV